MAPSVWDQFSQAPVAEAGKAPTLANNPELALPATGVQAAGDLGELHGEDYLKAIGDPARANQIKMFAEGRAPLPGGFALKTPYFQNMLTQISQYDPTFDATNYNARNAQRKNYMGGGKQFQEMQAIGTVAGHLQNLMEKADTLHNFEGLGPLNAPANSLLHGYREMAQDPRLAAFDTTKNAVTRELTKAYQGGHITDSSVNEWQKSISAAQTPEQLRTVIGNLNELLASKRRTLEEGYKQTMGANVSLPQDFTSENERTRKIFENVDAWSRGAKIEGSTNSAPAQMAAPKPGAYRYDPATRTLVPQ